MSASGRRSEPLAVGVDAGGTWVRGIAVAGGRPVARFAERAPRVPELASFLRRVWRRHGWRRARVRALVVASRGVWTAGERRAVRSALRELAGRVQVIADAEAAWLGALGDGAGVLVLAGTGSIVLGRDARGRWQRAGGLGPLFGDDGSAFALGREWLRARPPQARRLARRPDAVARIAAHAPAVLARARAGDRRALAIVREAQRRLARQARDVARRLALRGVVEVGWAGGLMSDRWFRAGVQRALARERVHARWHEPAVTPVVAAARLAARSP
jgi:N-acetylglucosamine kinase-like BadF-type ATPase